MAGTVATSTSADGPVGGVGAGAGPRRPTARAAAGTRLARPAALDRPRQLRTDSCDAG